MTLSFFKPLLDVVYKDEVEIGSVPMMHVVISTQGVNGLPIH